VSTHPRWSVHVPLSPVNAIVPGTGESGGGETPDGETRLEDGRGDRAQRVAAVGSVAHDATADELRAMRPAGLILAGGPARVYEPEGPPVHPGLEVVHLGRDVGLHLGPPAAGVGRDRTGVLPGVGGLLVHVHLGLVDTLAELLAGLRHRLWPVPACFHEIPRPPLVPA